MTDKSITLWLAFCRLACWLLDYSVAIAESTGRQTAGELRRELQEWDQHRAIAQLKWNARTK